MIKEQGNIIPESMNKLIKKGAVLHIIVIMQFCWNTRVLCACRYNILSIDYYKILHFIIDILIFFCFFSCI